MFRKIMILFWICLFLTGCAPKQEPVTEAVSSVVFAMDTVMNLKVYAQDADVLNRAEALIQQLDQELSVTNENSEIFAINRDGSGKVSANTAQLLEKALSLCSKTEGALDISVYPIVRAWGFTTDAYRIPEEAELKSLLEKVDYTKIQFEDGRVTLPEGMQIDLGSVAKGYTGDRLTALFREEGITSALLNLGGNVQALGAKPDGSPWKVGIQDPLGDGYLGVIPVVDQAVITSGGYERFFERDGKTYWHIMDPDTGRPAENGLISATAVGPEGVSCDALSTSLFVMGPEKAVRFWQTHRDFEMLLVTADGEILVTPGLDFTLWEGVDYEVRTLPEN